jgi:phenylpyruvate tautomerase
MPYLNVKTNKTVSAEKVSVVMDLLSKRLSKALAKPEDYVMVELQQGACLSFAGSAEPAAYLELKSISLPAVQTRPLSKLLCGILEEELQISPSRIYIEFTEAKGSHWGWNSTTF